VCASEQEREKREKKNRKGLIALMLPTRPTFSAACVVLIALLEGETLNRFFIDCQQL
jgi:hypothetical protein